MKIPIKYFVAIIITIILTLGIIGAVYLNNSMQRQNILLEKEKVVMEKQMELDKQNNEARLESQKESQRVIKYESCKEEVRESARTKLQSICGKVEEDIFDNENRQEFSEYFNQCVYSGGEYSSIESISTWIENEMKECEKKYL